MKAAHPDAEVQVWTMDEHRVGLKPIIRTIWAPKGTHPRAPVHQRYQWLYVYGFVRPGYNEATFVLLASVSSELMSQALEEFAREAGAGPGREIVLAMDQAGFHVSKKVKIPAHVHVVFMPSHSPELQPAERLWPITDEPLANKAPKDIDELEAILAQRCRTLLEHPELFASHIAFHWWPM